MQRDPTQPGDPATGPRSTDPQQRDPKHGGPAIEPSTPAAGPNQPPLLRSPLLMSTGDSALVVIDVQEKLLPLIPDHQAIVWNIGRLMDAAEILGVPVRATEQYPQGLGHTVDALRPRLAEIAEKTLFSCRECHRTLAQLGDSIRNLVLVGIESHVCVQQSSLDLLSQGYDVFVAADAIGARFPLDHEMALRRMEQNGVTLTTTEAVMFEWCESSSRAEFKAISRLVRQQRPG